MALLTKRVNLWLSESDHQMLKRISSQTGKSVSELIRIAVKKVYQMDK